MRSTAVAIGLLGSLVLVATGCGSKKAASPPPATTTAAATTTSSSSSGGGGSPSFASTKNCAQLASLAQKVAATLTPSSSLSETLKNEETELNALADAAPSEIKGDFKTFVQAFKGYADAIVKAGFKPGTVPTAQQVAALTTAAKAFDTPKLKAAEQHLTAWGHKNCGG